MNFDYTNGDVPFVNNSMGKNIYAGTSMPKTYVGISRLKVQPFPLAALSTHIFSP